jgi:mannose-6-phosphate isomerase-like protein (cupin superfamily)
MASPVRRVVTTRGHDGRSTRLADGPAPNVMVRKAAGWTSTVLWHTAGTPAAFSGCEDWSLGDFPVEPRPGGTVFRVVEFPPESAGAAAGDNAAILTELGLPAHATAAGAHRSMHRTDTVDYCVVLSGEIDMVLEDGEVHLQAGDVLVQQGTLHAFINRGTQPCRIAAVLVDARGAAAAGA